MKKALRQAIRQKIAALPAQTLHERSAAACRLLFEQVEYRKSEVVLIYLSTPTEVDTTPIALRAWADGKRVLAPLVAWEQRRMLPMEIRSLTTDVREGMMGIREPQEGVPVPVGEIDLVIVPGLAFDAAGNRLGRGRGFYDRFLAHRDYRAISCGLAFEEQVIDELPVEPNDRRMHILVSDARVRRFAREPR